MRLDIKYKEVERPVESVTATFDQNELWLIKCMADHFAKRHRGDIDVTSAALRLKNKLSCVVTNKDYNISTMFQD